MKKNKDKVVLITGASSGIGKSTAMLLAENNFNVYGTSRKVNDTDSYPYPMVVMDVRDDVSVQDAISSIIDKEKRIDVLINNAGMGVAGFIENSTIQHAKEQFETNFFGVFRVCKAVLPHMQKRSIGKIINISSLGGLFGLPLQGLYSASKFAVEGFTQSLRMELIGSGIRVISVNPGDVKTHFTHNRIKTDEASSTIDTNSNSKKVLSVIENDEMNGLNPDRVAKLIHRIINKKRPRARYLVGKFPQPLVPLCKKLLPAHTFEKLISSYYGVNK